jgi:hypothetical protein
MANLRDGGTIVLGIERQQDDTYLAVGMSQDHADSFVQDHLTSHFSEYADPFVEVTLHKHRADGKQFCILQVNEFAELPVVCKKDGLERLRRGATYTRSRRVCETVEVPTQIEMREILDIAIEKRSRAFARTADRMGFVPQTRRDEFVEQLKALSETAILNRIRSMARWHVWIRPTVFEKARFQDLAAAQLFVLANVVQIGGFPYPLLIDGEIQTSEESIVFEQNMVPLSPLIERWALFRSGQFVHDFALAEEFLGTQAWRTHPQYFVPGQGKKYLSIYRTLMIMSGIFEFAARMASRHLLDPGATLSLELHGLAGRELTFMDPRHRLEEKYWCRPDDIKIVRSLDPEELRSKSGDLALDMTIEIFQKFGWMNPPRSLLAEDQPRFQAN